MIKDKIVVHSSDSKTERVGEETTRNLEEH